MTKKVCEDVNKILLEQKRFIATIKAQGHEKTCSRLQEIADLIKSHATLEIKIPLMKSNTGLETITGEIFKVARQLKFKMIYGFDKKCNSIVIRLEKVR